MKNAPELEEFFGQWKDYPLLKSFIHLHLGFRGDGLPKSHCKEFPAQWGVFNDWSDLEAPRNAVLVSCPSMLSKLHLDTSGGGETSKARA